MELERLVDALLRRGETVAVAESLTGGLLAATLVTVPGVSRVFRGGLIVYATDLKATLAGVPVDLLAERGPVDPDVALALAAGARDRCGADWGLSTTGVAGPDPQGGVDVGVVFIAVARPRNSPGGPPGASPGTPPAGDDVRRLIVPGDRAAVRAGAVAAALDLLAERLSP